MSVQLSVQRGRRAAVALVAAGVVASGSLVLAGGATAGSEETEVGWPRTGGSASAARVEARAARADLAVEGVVVRDALVDVGDPGDSTGDFFYFEERLHRPGSDEVVGRDAVRCEVGIRTFACTATFKIFGKGKIVVESALFGERDQRVAITGGTGAYAGVGGVLRPMEGPDGSTLLAFRFTR